MLEFDLIINNKTGCKPPTDPAYLGPYTFCGYPGHVEMQQLSRMAMKPAADTLMDILSQLQLTERDADTDDDAEMQLEASASIYLSDFCRVKHFFYVHSN